MLWNTPIPGTLASAPSATAGLTGGPITLCTRGTDSNLWVTVSGPAGVLNFGPWRPAPGPGVILGRPGAIHVSATLVLFVVRSTQNDLWSIPFNPTTGDFTGAFRFEVAGQFASSPAGAIDANGVLWVVTVGFDNLLRVYRKFPEDDAFRTPLSIPGGSFIGDPAIGVGFGPTNITVFGIGLDRTGFALSADLTTGNLDAPVPMGGRHLAIAGVGTPGEPAAVSIGTDSRLYFSQFSGSWPGNPWHLVDEVPAHHFSDGIAGVNFEVPQGGTPPFLFGRSADGALLVSGEWPWGH